MPRRYNDEQRYILETLFNQDQYPSTEVKSGFAMSIGITQTQVSVWFQNRRVRMRRELARTSQANVVSCVSVNNVGTINRTAVESPQASGTDYSGSAGESPNCEFDFDSIFETESISPSEIRNTVEELNAACQVTNMDTSNETAARSSIFEFDFGRIFEMDVPMEPIPESELQKVVCELEADCKVQDMDTSSSI